MKRGAIIKASSARTSKVARPVRMCRTNPVLLHSSSQILEHVWI
jgi:hypothetical protein